MARRPVAFALLMLLAACTRAGTGPGRGRGITGAKPSLTDRMLNRDSEALCLQAATKSCTPFAAKLVSAALAECCRVKCRDGSAESCQTFLERHPVTTPGFWSWPKVKELPWGERLGVAAPGGLVEYLALQTGIDTLEAAGEDADFRKDLLAAWKELPAAERAEGAKKLIGVAAMKGLKSEVRGVAIRQDGKIVAGFLAFDWGTTLQPVNEWAKKTVEPSSRNHRRTTLLWLLRIGIARIAGRPEPKP